MTLPVLLLNAASDPAARTRTAASLAQQSVEVHVIDTLDDVRVSASAYVVCVLAGAVLDVTACERAAWFLAARPNVQCVTGAIAAQADGDDALTSVQHFLALRTDALLRWIADDRTLHAATNIALVTSAMRETGRGAGWLLEPVLSAVATDDATRAVAAKVRASLPQHQLDASALIDGSAGVPPLQPLQRLQCVTRPSLTPTFTPARGLRVLALLQGFPMGGYTAFNADLVPRLVTAGHAVTTCTTEWWRSDWRLDRVREVAPDIHHAHAVVPPTSVPCYIDWLISSRKIDVVLLSHSHVGFHLLPYLRQRHPRVAFVDYVHTDWFETNMYGSYAAMAARWDGQLDAQLSTSDALSTALITDGCDPDAVVTAHIGIDTEAWQHSGPRRPDIRASLNAGADTVVLLFAGRVSPEKRPHLAVDVVATLVSEGHDVLLLVVGGGPLIQATHECAVARGIVDRVSFLGEVDEHTLRDVYAASDVFLAPSEIEGIARSLYEAMAMGCVPVVSDVGGQRELVVPGTGSLVDARGTDAAAYVEGVRPWLDAASRERASRAARAHVAAHFDTSRTVGIVSDTFHLARQRRRTRQATLPLAMSEELAVQSLEITRRHVLRAVGR